jgi:hypothetical protein
VSIPVLAKAALAKSDQLSSERAVAKMLGECADGVFEPRFAVKEFAIGGGDFLSLVGRERDVLARAAGVVLGFGRELTASVSGDVDDATRLLSGLSAEIGTRFMAAARAFSSRLEDGVTADTVVDLLIEHGTTLRPKVELDLVGDAWLLVVSRGSVLPESKAAIVQKLEQAVERSGGDSLVSIGSAPSYGLSYSTDRSKDAPIGVAVRVWTEKLAEDDCAKWSRFAKDSASLQRQIGELGGTAWVGLKADLQDPRWLIPRPTLAVPPRSADGKFAKRVDEALLGHSFESPAQSGADASDDSSRECAKRELELVQLHTLQVQSGVKRMAGVSYMKLSGERRSLVSTVHREMIAAIGSKLHRCVGRETYEPLLLLSAGCVSKSGLNEALRSRLLAAVDNLAATETAEASDA